MASPLPTVRTIAELRAAVAALRRSAPVVSSFGPSTPGPHTHTHTLTHEPRIGFVPTMGALHEGHLALVHAARERGCTAVVASIFVNPTQFAPHEDLRAYPRTHTRDAAALAAAHADLLWMPTPDVMYPTSAPFRVWVDPVGLDAASPEGAARPGFFVGVCTVVAKLLGAARPDDAFFGQKDGIQCIAVRSMVRDLNIPTRVWVCPTVRAPDGLALSSRNVYLGEGPEGRGPKRDAAPALYAALLAMRDAIGPSASRPQVPKKLNLGADPEELAQRLAAARTRAHTRAHTEAHTEALTDGDAAKKANGIGSRIAENEDPQLQQLRELGERVLREKGRGEFGELQYITFSDALTGAPLARLSDSTARHGAVLLSIAARIGSTRLLDNIVLFGTEDDLGEAP